MKGNKEDSTTNTCSRGAASPGVSVIIPAYNVAEFIAETLNSVLSQSYTDYEIILVNDGSPDTEKLRQVIKPFMPNLIYIEQANGGTACARNTGIRAARGKWLAFLDGDDAWFPNYLSEQMHALSKKNCELIYADALLFGSVRDSSRTYMQKSQSVGNVSVEALIKATCNVITSGTVVLRDAVMKVGMFDEQLPRIGMEDFDLWVRLARARIKIDYHRKVVIKYRVHSSSLSGSNIKRAQREITALNIIRNKYELSEAEIDALEKRLILAQATLAIEKGKSNLVRKEYRAALSDIRAAHAFDPKIKLKTISILLGVFPNLAFAVFRLMRAKEFAFIMESGETINPQGGRKSAQLES